MNPDFPNRFVIMGDREGRLIAWDTTRNRIITNAQFHHAPVLSVAYQPAGNGAFLSAGGDGELKIRLPEGKRFTVHAHDGPMFQAGYSASERHVYTVGADRTAKVWDLPTRSAESSSSRSGGGNKALNLWVVTSGRLIGHMQGHTSDIESVQFSPNGRVVVSAGEDNSVKIWSVDNQQELAMLVFQKNGNQYAGVTFDNRAFGDRNSGLLSVYIDGKQASPSEAEHVVEYIGRGIVIMETDN